MSAISHDAFLIFLKRELSILTDTNYCWFLSEFTRDI